jgi:pimeloyl-ACP methyl ester carboxylesterase
VPQVAANGIQLEYESFGASDDPAVILIMGLGAQLTRWPVPFCEALVAQGFRVIRFDNRDVGLSTKLDTEPVPMIASIVAARMAGRKPQVPYTLHDMAADTVGLMDALGIARAHLAGVSMGGMIAQLVAADYPQRVLSLTSIMSTSGNPSLPPPTPAAAATLISRAPHPDNLAAYVQHVLGVMRVLASPAAPFDEEALRARIERDVRRSYSPAGYGRQLAAVTATGDRSASLRRIKAPTVVVHGAEDPLLPLAAGIHTADLIPGAELRIVRGMGHDMPPMFYDAVIGGIVSAAQRA